MEEVGRISEPLGGQSPDVIEWSRSLRSRSPSPSNSRQNVRSPSPSTSRQKLRSRSPSPPRISSARGREEKENSSSNEAGVYLTDIPKSSNGFPQHSVTKMKKSSSTGLRKSTGNLMASFERPSGKVTKSTTNAVVNNDLGNIEAEYIKNLQQQIYFLELESNYLREQAKKATEMHPKMTAEAERMLSKLRAMQSEIDTLQIAVKEKESALAQTVIEREKLAGRLKDEEVSKSRDKRMFMDEIIQLKKEKDTLEHENSRKDSQIMEARKELDMSATALRNAEIKIQTLKAQIDQRVEQHKMTQISLDEKRSELLSTETQLREVEEKYYNSTVQIQDKVTNDLRDEIRILRQKLKETEMNADHDRYLKTKMSEDSSHLVRENAMLNQQILELQKQLGREQELRDNSDARHSQHVSELVQLRDKEKEARFELQHIQQQLQKEQERCRGYSEQLTNQESVTTSKELQLNTSRSRAAELEGLNSSLEHENTQLRKDKNLLVDHVSDLQRKIEAKEQEIVLLRNQVQSMEVRLKEVEHLKNLEATVQTQKWEEFEKLAESMRSLSHTMSSTGMSTTRINQY